MNWADWARGAYGRAPHSIRHALRWPLSLVPTSMLMGRSFRRHRELIARAAQDPHHGEAHILHAFDRVFQAAARAPAYQPTVGRIGAMSRFATIHEAIEALSQFPVITKADIRGRELEFVVGNRSELDSVTTSGSTGTPTLVYLDKDRGAKEWAFVTSAWALAGYRPGDARCVLRGVEIRNADRNPVEWDPALRELRCSVFHLTPAHIDHYLDEIERRSINYMHGYPSAITLIANHMERRGRRSESIRGVFTTSEALHAHQEALIRRVFPRATPVPFYGQSEKVAFARRSDASTDDYTFSPLYGWTELLDDHGEPVTEPGSVGRIIATGFLSGGMPLIRYDTGDVATLVAPARFDNGYSLRVCGLVGRWKQEYLVGANGSLVSIAAVNIHSKRYLALHEFRFVQFEPGKAELQVVVAPGYAASDVNRYVAEVASKLGREFEIELRLVDEISSGPRGKRTLVDQHIDLAHLNAPASPAAVET